MRLLLAMIQFLLFSCTLIEDSDITSEEELLNITLKSVEMKIETNTAISTIKATATSVVHSQIIVPGGTVTKQVWMDWPALNSKLKLRSGITKSFKSYTSYLKDGKPYTFYLFDSDSVIFELYRFRYDTKGRLNQIITNAPFVDGGPATSRDTLIYGTSNNNTSEVTSIVRKSADPSKEGTFTINAGSFFNLQGFNFQGTTFTKACQGNGCGPYWGGDYYSAPNSGDGFPYGVMNLGISPGQYYIEDINKDVSNFCDNKCIQSNDTYYLHPLMILKDHFEYGDNLLFMYMVDWWQPISAVESNKNEKITFSFRYDL